MEAGGGGGVWAPRRCGEVATSPLYRFFSWISFFDGKVYFTALSIFYREKNRKMICDHKLAAP